LSNGQAETAFQYIDKAEREDRDALIAGLAQATETTEEVASQILMVGDIRGLEGVIAALREKVGSNEAAEPLTACVSALSDMGLAEFVDVDLGIVRGLAYYTGIVYELFDAGKSLRAVCGGGRYDGLLDALGGADLPATGFGMGDVVLGELLQDRGLVDDSGRGLDAFIVAVTVDDVPQVLAVTHRLRDQGLRVEYALKSQPIAKQLKLAAARPSQSAVIIGPDERRTGEAVVRNLNTGEERRVSFDAIQDVLVRS
jgi:histidyl-tRNA synthetase